MINLDKREDCSQIRYDSCEIFNTELTTSVSAGESCLPPLKFRRRVF
jgi:hypothetical protein